MEAPLATLIDCSRSSDIPVKNAAVPASERKRLGAYYTPESLSRVLTDWAIRSRQDIVLEPSFGGCGFLAAARRRLEELGCEAPRAQIFGCDVDEAAFRFLAEVLGQPVDTDRFRKDDFLDLDANKHWPQLFDAAIGNPPYIPYQAIPEARRQEYARRWNAKGLNIAKRASLWAHFLIHTVSFVAPGGRMAWVLPGAFLQAQYAEEVRKYIGQSFGEILCVLMHQRFFKELGTEEETVVLLAKNRLDTTNPCEIVFVDAATVDELTNTICTWDAGIPTGKKLDGRPSFLSITPSVLESFQAVQAEKDCGVLGSFLSARIGLVTGANSFFVLSDADRKKFSLGEDDTVPILAKLRAAKGLDFTLEDHLSHLGNGGRGHLVHSKHDPKVGSCLRSYLDTFPEEIRAKISTFKKRAVWHAPDDGNVPDAFLSVMNHDGPRLVINNLKVNCTNTIHRAYFRKPESDYFKKLVAVTLLTSFSQLSAEFVGRRYGSGVLKHEPREIEKINILIPTNISSEDVLAAYREIDALLRSGSFEAAYVRADEFVLYRMPNGSKYSEIFLAALKKARRLRRSSGAR